MNMMDSVGFHHQAYNLAPSSLWSAQIQSLDAVFTRSFRVPIGTLAAFVQILVHRPPIPCPFDQHQKGSHGLPFCFYGVTLTKGEIMT